ncbi:hypothetical protein Strain138_000339 [Pseudogemmatithrix spongiicola]|uniref:Uncharacterized protein n=1 Tax=Pseudogemmatithrix spongiicola TaxID=3062599 RepID=A0AA49JSF2_9BACT|nr:hypothetical protein Strain138_000339 [Gemmatimonadaceae bacterium 'strain 138']WKW14014.1 hypothetical protein Strain318_000339 [Gemmatimonadaceae bacterium 'strain 318']
MATHDEIIQPYVATVEMDGRRYNVSVRITYDGIEYVGRLWFADEAWDDLGLPDRGALPGRSREEVIALAKRMSPQELIKRHRRALAEKRRFLGLRKHTDEILAKIRYLNQVAVSMRAGLLDVEAAAEEIDLTERQLHQLIDTLSEHAGKEE